VTGEIKTVICGRINSALVSLQLVQKHSLSRELWALAALHSHKKVTQSNANTCPFQNYLSQFKSGFFSQYYKLFSDKGKRLTT